MSILGNSIVGQTSTCLHIKPYSRLQALAWNPISKLGLITKQKDNFYFSSSSLIHRRNDNEDKRDFTIYASSVPGIDPLPSGPPSNNINSWILGIVVSLVLPFLTHKLGPLGVLKNRFENAVKAAECILEVEKKIAEEVEHVAEDIVNRLPDGQLKNLAHLVEDVAEKAVEAGDKFEHFIEEVEEAEEKVECIVESVTRESKKSSAEKK